MNDTVELPMNMEETACISSLFPSNRASESEQRKFMLPSERKATCPGTTINLVDEDEY